MFTECKKMEEMTEKKRKYMKRMIQEIEYTEKMSADRQTDGSKYRKREREGRERERERERNKQTYTSFFRLKVSDDFPSSTLPFF